MDDEGGTPRDAEVSYHVVEKATGSRRLIKFWLGHSESSVTDSYSKLADDVELRRQVAQKVGTGFEVPTYEAIAMRPKRPRKSDKRKIAVAA